MEGKLEFEHSKEFFNHTEKKRKAQKKREIIKAFPELTENFISISLPSHSLCLDA
jgi:hypothetical protein